MVIPMITMLIGALLNIVLDPILIFGYFGLPAMGVEGAAIATVTAQFVSMLFVWRALLFGKSILKLNPRGFKPMISIIRQILLIGIPVALMQGLGSVMLTGFNSILSQFGDVAISVMGVYFKLQSMVFMPVFGLATGVLPIVGYNYGAKNKQRLYDTIKYSVIYATGFMIICFVIFQVFSSGLLALFNPSDEMIVIGIPAFKTVSMMFPFLGITIIFSTAFQAFGKAHYSLLISVVRQLLLLLPIAYILSQTGNIDMIWYAFLMTEFVSIFLVVGLFRNTYKKSVELWV